MSLSCSNRPICVDSRLDGYWNMVLDSFVINRSAKVEFGSINFNFTCKNVELPLLQTPRVDVKGKTLLDADINEDSLKKDWSNYQKAIRESNGTWELYSSKGFYKNPCSSTSFQWTIQDRLLQGENLWARTLSYANVKRFDIYCMREILFWICRF